MTPPLFGDNAAVLFDCLIKALIAAAGVLGGVVANRAFQFFKTRFGAENSPVDVKRQIERRRARMIVVRTYLAAKTDRWHDRLLRVLRLHRTERQILKTVLQMRKHDDDASHVLTPAMLDACNADGDQNYQRRREFEETERSILEMLAGSIVEHSDRKHNLTCDATRLAAVVRQLYEYRTSLCKQLAHDELRQATTLAVDGMGESLESAVKHLERRVQCLLRKLLAGQAKISTEIGDCLSHVRPDNVRVPSDDGMVVKPDGVPSAVTLPAEMPPWMRPVVITGTIAMLLLIGGQIAMLYRIFQ